jgi:hypothetical protein
LADGHGVTACLWLARGIGVDAALTGGLDLLRLVEVAPPTTEGLRKATRLEMRVFEDAMLVVAAEACRAGVIATRNVRDYVRSPLRAATPKAFLGELGS